MKSLSHVVSKKTKFAHARRLAEMCCVDLQPFNIVEKIGFQKYAHYIDKSLTFPTATTVATTALNDVYNVYLCAVKESLKNCPKDISLVLDMWTDKYRKISYINIKIHYCENFNIKIVSLKTEHFPHPHTGELVARNVADTLEQFGLQNKNITAVSDGGSNIIKSLRIQTIVRFSCLAHSLHLFITSDILENTAFTCLRDTIMKMKHIFRCLNYRSEDIRRIQIVQENSECCKIINKIEQVCKCLESDDSISIGDFEEQLEEATSFHYSQSLKNPVVTRWNSVLVMIKSFSENFLPINMILLKVRSENLIITEMQKELIIEFGKFLDIFSEATTYLQGQQYATISSCIYFYENIHSKLIEREITSTFGIIIELYSFAKECFCKRFKIMKVHLVAALLDPCQKNWSLLECYVKRYPDWMNVPENYVLENEVENYVTKEQIIYREILSRNLYTENSMEIISLEEPPRKVISMSVYCRTENFENEKQDIQFKYTQYNRI